MQDPQDGRHVDRKRELDAQEAQSPHDTQSQSPRKRLAAEDPQVADGDVADHGEDDGDGNDYFDVAVGDGFHGYLANALVEPISSQTDGQNLLLRALLFAGDAMGRSDASNSEDITCPM